MVYINIQNTVLQLNKPILSDSFSIVYVNIILLILFLQPYSSLHPSQSYPSQPYPSRSILLNLILLFILLNRILSFLPNLILLSILLNLILLFILLNRILLNLILLNRILPSILLNSILFFSIYLSIDPSLITSILLLSPTSWMILYNLNRLCGRIEYMSMYKISPNFDWQIYPGEQGSE